MIELKLDRYIQNDIRIKKVDRKRIITILFIYIC